MCSFARLLVCSCARLLVCSFACWLVCSRALDRHDPRSAGLLLYCVNHVLSELIHELQCGLLDLELADRFGVVIALCGALAAAIPRIRPT